MIDCGDYDHSDNFDDLDDDLLLAAAAEATVADCGETSSTSGSYGIEKEDIANISFGVENTDKGNDIHDMSGFDSSSGQIWIYPTNYPIRDYQYNIVQQALHKNTLVVLPTGLGKTFIAAVVMYNLYRWFPQGKVVFMAPTKPLVAQQIHACYSIMGIPKVDTVEMTGNMHPTEREKNWRQKRVIFLTPQVMTNDLSRGSLAATSIKCLVVDEAHKATGNHAYCQVVRELLNFSQEFRVLALSATPGSDLKRVQQVISNLLIAHIELRSEDSIDIRPYTHERNVDKVVVPMGEELSGIRLKYIQIMDMVIKRLIKNKVLYNREATKLSKFLILKAREEYRQNPPMNLQGPQCGMIEGDFAMAMSLYHGFELLQLHGLRSLHNFLLGIQSGEKGYGRTRYELARNPNFIEIMESLQEKFASKALIGKGAEKDEKMAVGHPKMQRLEEIVVEHFKSFQEKNLDTRVMIFSQYRDSVEEIKNILNQHHPLVKVMTFIGQSSVGKSTKGFSQKEQLKVMRQFREGGYNTLVSTCVGEEGLDIGDVDLIVCFDAHKSPIRLVQRMGRTGRKRKGRIVMLVTEGKEEQIYNQSLYSKKSIHKAILNGAKTLHFYPHNPPLIPPGLKPKCHKMYITVKPESESKKSTLKTKSRASLHSDQSTSNISTAFGKARSRQSEKELSRAEYEEIRAEFCEASRSSRRLPQSKCMVLSNDNEGSPKLVQENDTRELNLSEWTPWQNRLQQTHFFGHSTITEHFVKTCEFIELQQSIGEAANSYGLEMELYLNKADIHGTSVLNKSVPNVPGQSNITSFFTPSQKSKQENSSTKQDSDKSVSKGIGRKVRRHETSREVGKTSYNDRDDKDQESDKDLNKSVKSSHISSKLFTVLKPVMEREEDDMETAEESLNVRKSVLIVSRDRNKAVMNKGQKKKKKLINVNQVFWNIDSLETSEKCVEKRKKSGKNMLCKATAEQQSCRNKGLFEDCRDDSLTKSVRVDSDKDIVHTSLIQQELLHENLSFENCVEFEENCSVLNPAQVDHDRGTVKEICEDLCPIAVAPRVEEVAEMLGQTNSPVDFSSLDMYKLVDEWRKRDPMWKSLHKMSDLSTKTFVETKDVLEIIGGRIKNDSLSTRRSGKVVESMFNGDNKASCGSLLKTENLKDKSISKDLVRKMEIDGFNHVFNRNENNGSINKNSKSCDLQTETDNNLFSHNENKGEELDGALSLPAPVCSEGIISPGPVGDHNNKMLSPNDSIDNIMQNIGEENCLLSPVTKSGNKSRLGESYLKNASSHSQSFATFSQAMLCLHSSSSDNGMLSANLLGSRGKTLNVFGGGDQSHLSSSKDIMSPPGGSKKLKTKPNFISSSASKKVSNEKFEFPSTSKNLKHGEYVQPSMEDFQVIMGKDSETEIDLCLSSDDNSCGQEIIPPTPHKSNSVSSFGSSQVPQVSSLTRNTLCQDETQPPVHKVFPRNTAENVAEIENTISSLSPNRDGHGLGKRNGKNLLTSPLKSSNEENCHVVNMLQDSLQDFDWEEDDCVIVTPPPGKKKLPFAFHENTDCIEILASQEQEISSCHKPASSSSSSPKGNLPFGGSSQYAMNSGIKENKKLSLKSANAQVPSDHQLSVVEGSVNTKQLSLRSPDVHVKASTPLVKNFQSTQKALVNDDHDNEDDAMLYMDHLTPIKGYSPNEDRDDEESFVIRRKKKPCAVLDLSSQEESSKMTSWLSARKTDMKKPNETSKEGDSSLEKRQSSVLNDIQEEDDFEAPAPVVSKDKSTFQQHPKGFKPRKKRKDAKFIEDEAEVSEDDMTSDEDEEGYDCYEASFIHNDTEMTQEDGTDMRAVYLKSVKSLVSAVPHGRYKLQQNTAANFDIYSQTLPDDHGLSEYEEDSFCVGSEEEDSPVVKKKSRRKNERQEGKKLKKKRIRMMSDSSSDEEKAFPFTQEVTTNHRAAVLNALMSSSEDEAPARQSNISSTSEQLNSDKNKSKRSVSDETGFNKDTSFSSVSNLKTDKSSQAITSECNFITEDMMWDEWQDNFNAGKTDLESATKTGTSVFNEGGDLQLPQFARSKRKFDDDSESSVTEGTSNQASLPSSNILPRMKIDHKPICTPADSVQSAGVKNLPSIYDKSSSLNTSEYPSCLVKAASSSMSYQNSFVTTASSSLSPPQDMSTVSTAVPVVSNIRKSNELLVPPRDTAREERLKRQKEKQERFRQKMAQAQQAKSPNVANVTEAAKTFPPPAASSSISTKIPDPADKEVLQVLVDTKEVSAAQEVISGLRLKHGVTVSARQIGSCDYVLSNYLVVDRMYWSAFSNGSNRTKLVSRFREMQSTYRKYAVIVETDKVKLGQEKNRKPLQHSKYVDRTMACIIQTGIKLYFTDSSEQTASLLSELCHTEQRKRRHLSVPTKLNDKREAMFNFVISIPQINVVEALNLVHQNKSVAELVSSPAAVLQHRGILTSDKAQWVYNYLRHNFDPQMTPAAQR